MLIAIHDETIHNNTVSKSSTAHICFTQNLSLFKSEIQANCRAIASTNHTLLVHRIESDFIRNSEASYIATEEWLKNLKSISSIFHSGVE